MTAPVTQAKTDQGWTMTFMMPSQYKLEDLPKPKDERIQFSEIPKKTFGVVRFSGFNSESKIEQKTNELRGWLRKRSEYQIISHPAWAGYDPPWTIPFFRRNEVLLELKN